MEKILKYLTIIPGSAMLLFSIYIMGIAQDINMIDTVSTIIKIVVYIVSLLLVFLSISIILYSLSVINKEEEDQEEPVKKQSKVYKAFQIFGYAFWTLLVIAITYFGRNSLKGEIFILMFLFWLSAIYTLYKLVTTIIKKKK